MNLGRPSTWKITKWKIYNFSCIESNHWAIGLGYIQQYVFSALPRAATFHPSEAQYSWRESAVLQYDISKGDSLLKRVTVMTGAGHKQS